MMLDVVKKDRGPRGISEGNQSAGTHSVSAPVPVDPKCYHGGKGTVNLHLGMTSFSGFRVLRFTGGLVKAVAGPTLRSSDLA